MLITRAGYVAAPNARVSVSVMASIRVLLLSSVVLSATWLMEAQAQEPPILKIARSRPADSPGLEQLREDDTSPATGLGLSFESNLIYGTAAFLVDRANAEAALGFMSRLDGELCDLEDGRKMKVLFPQTCALIYKQRETVLVSLGGAWRAAFADDLQALPEHLVAWIYENSSLKLTDEAKMALESYLVVVRLAREIEHGTHPVRALQRALEHAKTRKAPTDWIKAVELALTVLSSLEGVDGTLGSLRLESTPLIGVNTWRALSTGERAQILSETNAPPSELESLAKKWIEISQEVNDHLREIRGRTSEQGGAKVTPGDFARLVRSAIKFTDEFPALFTVLKKDTLAANWKNNIIPRLAKVGDVVEGFANRDYARSFLLTISVAAETVSTLSEKLPPDLMRLAAFAANVASAKSSDEVKTAIEAAAAPVGSYREKGGGWYFTVNAYVGGAIGQEVVGGESSSAVGVFAPIGVEGGVGTKFIRLGLFASLVDLGAVVSYRLDEDRTEDNEEIEQQANIGLAQIFSPGIYLTVGFPSALPLSLGAGVARTPELRSLKMGEAETEASALRFQAFLALDLTLYPF